MLYYTHDAFCKQSFDRRPTAGWRRESVGTVQPRSKKIPTAGGFQELLIIRKIVAPSAAGAESCGMILISACLAGVECRYNGKAFPVDSVIELFRAGKALPVCPELLAGFSSPREPGEIRNGRVINADGSDQTDRYEEGAWKALDIALAAGCRKAILKAKSPTCGCGKIYDGTFSHTIIDGDGVFAALLKRHNIDVITEEDL